jgi:hypothetical protein
MGISFVAGRMLSSDLTRDTDLAFNSNLIYLNVGANRVGINTASPASTLEVAGNITIGHITIPNVGNINVGNVTVTNIAEPVQNSDAATKYYVDQHIGNVTSIGNLTFTDTTISSNIANANINIQPPGTGEFKIISTNGFIIPVGNVAQRPASPVIGTLRFNNSTNQLEVYDGVQWDSATNNQSIVTDQTITPDGYSLTYTLTQNTTADAVLVSINGISQTPSVDYTVTANNITFTSTPLDSDIVQVRYIAATTSISAFNLPGYTVAESANIATPVTGQLIYVSNGNSGSPCLAVYSGGSFKRIALGTTIST